MAKAKKSKGKKAKKKKVVAAKKKSAKKASKKSAKKAAKKSAKKSAKKAAKKSAKKAAKKTAKKAAPKKSAPKKRPPKAAAPMPEPAPAPAPEPAACSRPELGHAEPAQPFDAVLWAQPVIRRRRPQRLGKPFSSTPAAIEAAAPWAPRPFASGGRGRPSLHGRFAGGGLSALRCVSTRISAGRFFRLENRQNCCWNATHRDNLSWNRPNAQKVGRCLSFLLHRLGRHDPDWLAG